MKHTNGAANQVISAAIILGLSSLGSRFIGLIRERVLTTTFGAGDTFDAFVAAFRLPDLIFNLVVVGALSAAFIPLFTEKLVKAGSGKRQANDFAISVLNVVLLIVIPLSALYALAAPWIVPLITPGFTGEKLTLTIQLSRIMALQPIFLGISFVFSGVLNSYKRFIAYAIAPILYNVGIIIGVMYFVPLVGLAGLAWGVVLGGILHMAVQVPSMLAVDFKWRPIIAWASSDFTKLRRMIIPRVFGLAAQQVNLFMVTILGSGLAAGSISVFHLANNIQSLPIGIFGLSFAQAAFPTLAEHVARKQPLAFRHTLTKTFRYILFLVIPTTIIFFLLRAQIVRVLFGDGAFDWEDTIFTFRTLALLVSSLFAQATIPLLTRAFYVRQDTRTPVIISLISIIVNIVLALFLSPTCGRHILGSWRELPCGVEGLALAFSISAIVNLILLLSVLHIQLDGFDDTQVLRSLARITVAAVISGGVVQALKYPVAYFLGTSTFIGVFMQLVVASAGGLAVYLALCMLFKCEELHALRRFIPKKAKLLPGTETPRFGGLSE